MLNEGTILFLILLENKVPSAEVRGKNLKRVYAGRVGRPLKMIPTSRLSRCHRRFPPSSNPICLNHWSLIWLRFDQWDSLAFNRLKWSCPRCWNSGQKLHLSAGWISQFLGWMIFSFNQQVLFYQHHLDSKHHQFSLTVPENTNLVIIKTSPMSRLCFESQSNNSFKCSPMI